MKRQEIVDYIHGRLGKALCAAVLENHGGMTFGEAVISSVETGSYDAQWARGDYSNVERYIAGLKETWVASQGDISHLIMRIHQIRAFGTEQERAQLAKLLELPS